MPFRRKKPDQKINDDQPQKLKQTQPGDIEDISDTQLAIFENNIRDIEREISKQALSELPLAAFTGQILVVDTINDCKDACEVLGNYDLLGFDTETRPSFKKGEIHNIAIIQLSAPSVVYLFRLNKIGIPDCLKQILENPNIIKAGIALENDIPELRYYSHLKPKGMIDLNRICSRLEFKSIGARKLAGLFLGFRMSKAQQTSNWENEVLSNSQQIYAATDAWVCREIYRKMAGIL